jgi:hypothetical protein
MSPSLIAIALGLLVLGIWQTVVQARLSDYIIKRLENPMNSSTKLAALYTAALGALNAANVEIATLKAEIAAADPTVTADLQADEAEIANFETALAAAGVTLPAPAATTADPALAAAPNSIADQLAAAAAEAGAAH